MKKKSVRIISLFLLLILITNGCAGRDECPSCEVCEVCEDCELCQEPAVEEEAATSEEILVNIDDVELVEFDNQLYLINLLNGEDILLVEDSNYENIGIINNNFIITNWGENKVQFFDPAGSEVYYDSLEGFSSLEIDEHYLIFFEEADPDTPDQEQNFVILNTEDKGYLDLPSDAFKNGYHYYTIESDGKLINPTYSIEAFDYEGKLLGSIETQDKVLDAAITENQMLVALENGSPYLLLIDFNRPDTYMEVLIGYVTNIKLDIQSDHKATISYINEIEESVTDTILFTDLRVIVFRSDESLEIIDW